MTKINVLLLIALIASCVYLVRVSHDSRQLFALLDRARNDARLLDSEFERLKSEQQSQATPLRVEKTAVQRLGMVPATPAVMRQVGDPNVAVVAASAAASGSASVPASLSSSLSASAALAASSEPRRP